MGPFNDFIYNYHFNSMDNAFHVKIKWELKMWAFHSGANNASVKERIYINIEMKNHI